MEELLAKAISIAKQAHEGQLDKAGWPYIGHITRVGMAGKTTDEKITGALHDVVKYSSWTFEALLAEGFPVHIVDALRCLTRLSDDEPYEEYINRIKSNPLAVSVKINDLADNMYIILFCPLYEFKEAENTWKITTIDRRKFLEKESKQYKKYRKAYEELLNSRCKL